MRLNDLFDFDLSWLGLDFQHRCALAGQSGDIWPVSVLPELLLSMVG